MFLPANATKQACWMHERAGVCKARTAENIPYHIGFRVSIAGVASQINLARDNVGVWFGLVSYE
jgi:hypothetical protein